MSKFSKYLIDNSRICTFSFQNDIPSTEFKASHSRGFFNWVVTSNAIWEINIQGFDENNNLIYQSEDSGNDSTHIHFDFNSDKLFIKYFCSSNF